MLIELREMTPLRSSGVFTTSCTALTLHCTPVNRAVLTSTVSRSASTQTGSDPIGGFSGSSSAFSSG